VTIGHYFWHSYGQPSKRLPEIMGTPLTPEDKQAYCPTVATAFQEAGNNSNSNSGVVGVGVGVGGITNKILTGNRNDPLPAPQPSYRGHHRYTY